LNTKFWRLATFALRLSSPQLGLTRPNVPFGTGGLPCPRRRN